MEPNKSQARHIPGEFVVGRSTGGDGLEAIARRTGGGFGLDHYVFRRCGENRWSWLIVRNLGGGRRESRSAQTRRMAESGIIRALSKTTLSTVKCRT